jgi:hypothetical protein
VNAPEGAARLARLEAAEAEARAQYVAAASAAYEAAARGTDEAASVGTLALAAQWIHCRDDLAALRRELAESVRR